MDGRRLRWGEVGLPTLFAVHLMTAVKSSDYKSSTDNLISKQRIAKDVVGNNGSVFTWREREVFTKLSVMIVGLSVKI